LLGHLVFDSGDFARVPFRFRRPSARLRFPGRL
jgi:hypothetical protein